MKRDVFILLFMSVSMLCFAQKSDVGNWFIYFGNQRINKNWNWHNELQYRNYNFAGDLQQMLVRTGLGYNLTENNNNVLMGYAFINSQHYLPDSEEKSGTNEHRIYQQFITRQNFSRVFIQHRYRIEERFLPSDFQVRFRYFLSINVPFNNKTMIEKAFYASAYNEIFINKDSPIFDRNRMYAGVGYVANKNVRLEAGFMAQSVEKNNRNQFQIIVFNNIPFTNN